ncbi:MAG: hypothetical protein ABW168_13750 [Sedimenticola sp.]
MKKHGELRIHIGAHKTATTHLQDTINAMGLELLESKIYYIQRHLGRSKIVKVTPWGVSSIKYRLLFGFFKREYIKKTLFSGIRLDEVILISEENILGGIVDELSSKPYPKIYERLEFIRQLSKEFSTKIFLSIRSFDRVLPGTYITGLIHQPEKAIIAKQKLITDLDNQLLPRWVDVIDRIKIALPDIPLYIWTQEDYRNNSDKIICKLLNKKIMSIPIIAPPLETTTPSYESVSDIEKLFEKTHVRPTNWVSVCSSIFSLKPAKNDADRYTFLNPSQIKQLKSSYKEDLKSISELWPNTLISFSDSPGERREDT